MTAIQRKWTIYKITNPLGQSYIGKSYNFKGRIGAYRNCGKAIERQRLIYNSILQYDYEAHTIEIIDEFISDALYAEGKEMFWIRSNMSNRNMWPENEGLNLTKGGNGGLGIVLTPARKKQIGDNRRGKPISEKVRAAFSKSWHKSRKGVIISSNGRNNMSLSAKGRPNKFKGTTRSPEYGIKISESRKRASQYIIHRYNWRGDFIKEYRSIHAVAVDLGISCYIAKQALKQEFSNHFQGGIKYVPRCIMPPLQ